MPHSAGWPAWAEAKTAKARAKSRWREVADFDARALRGQLAGRQVVSFASNDYFGLSAHPSVLAAAREALGRWGAGAGSARLLGGSRPVHSELEASLAAWKGSEAAVTFPSGFQANVGTLSALAAPGVLFCGDALNHASIIDGCRLATALGATFKAYPHGDAGAANDLIASWPGRAVLVTDTVFSMDGDLAPVAQLSEACAAHGALLVLDEAHAALGPHFGELACEVLHVGTLSKMLGSQGGFVAGRRQMVELLVNRCRGFIFTTALAPPSAAAALAALGVLASPEGAALVATLRRHAARVAPERPVPTPIVPVILGSEAAALRAASQLLERGLWVPAIRPPTVPPGSCRLRVSLSAAHSDEEVSLLLDALAGLRATLGPHGRL